MAVMGGNGTTQSNNVPQTILVQEECGIVGT